MRNIITISSLSIMMIIYVILNIMIISNNIRDNEADRSLSCAMDYGIDVIGQMYYTIDFDKSDKEKCMDDLMYNFCQSISRSINTDSDVKVQLLDVDIKRGSFHFMITEEYNYIFGKKKGVSFCERAVAFK